MKTQQDRRRLALFLPVPLGVFMLVWHQYEPKIEVPWDDSALLGFMALMLVFWLVQLVSAWHTTGTLLEVRDNVKTSKEFVAPRLAAAQQRLAPFGLAMLGHVHALFCIMLRQSATGWGPCKWTAWLVITVLSPACFCFLVPLNSHYQRDSSSVQSGTERNKRTGWLQLLGRHYCPEALIVAVGLCVLLLGLFGLSLLNCSPDAPTWWQPDPRRFTSIVVHIGVNFVGFVQVVGTTDLCD